MYRRYSKRKVHLVDEAIEKHKDDLPGFLDRLIEHFGPEPPLAFSWEMFPELVPLRTANSLEKLLQLANFEGTPFEDDALEEMYTERSGRSVSIGGTPLRKPPKGEIDLAAERQAVFAQEHRGRAHIQNADRRFFYNAQLKFSDERHLIKQKEHNEMLQLAADRERQEDLDRRRMMLLRQQMKEEQELRDTQIAAMVALENKDRIDIHHESKEEWKRLMKEANVSLCRCQRIQSKRARQQAQRRRTQIDGNDAELAREIEEERRRALERAEEEKRIAAEEKAAKNDAKPKKKAPIEEMTDALEREGLLRKKKKKQTSDEPLSLDEYRRQKMRRLSMLNLQQREIIGRRMSEKQKHKEEEKEAALEASRSVSMMLEAVQRRKSQHGDVLTRRQTLHSQSTQPQPTTLPPLDKRASTSLK